MASRLIPRPSRPRANVEPRLSSAGADHSLFGFRPAGVRQIHTQPERLRALRVNHAGLAVIFAGGRQVMDYHQRAIECVEHAKQVSDRACNGLGTARRAA
jgi:hypothetical protein